MTNNENNACVLEAKDTSLPWWPFVLSLLCTMPHTWWYSEIAINIPNILKMLFDDTTPWTVFDFTLCVITIIATFIGLIGMLFRKKWGLWITLLIFGYYTIHWICDVRFMLTAPPAFEVNHPLLVLAGISITFYYFVTFSCCLLGLWTCRRIKYRTVQR